MEYFKGTEDAVAEFPIEAFRQDRLTARLQAAMIEALYKQGLLTEAQRRALCAILRCDGFGHEDER